MKKLVLILLSYLLSSIPCGAVSWITIDGGRALRYTDFSGVSWTYLSRASGAWNQPRVSIRLYDAPFGGRAYNACHVDFHGGVGPQCVQFEPYPIDPGGCKTQSDAANQLNLWLHRAILWNRFPEGPAYQFYFECYSGSAGPGWRAMWTGSETPDPVSCNASTATVNVSLGVGSTGSGRSSFDVTCSRTADVRISIPSETVQLTNGGSTELSLDDQGPDLTLRGISSATVHVSASVTDPTLAAGVYIGSTVVTIAPM